VEGGIVFEGRGKVYGRPVGGTFLFWNGEKRASESAKKKGLSGLRLAVKEKKERNRGIFFKARRRKKGFH